MFNTSQSTQLFPSHYFIPLDIYFSAMLSRGKNLCIAFPSLSQLSTLFAPIPIPPLSLSPPLWLVTCSTWSFLECVEAVLRTDAELLAGSRTEGRSILAESAGKSRITPRTPCCSHLPPYPLLVNSQSLPRDIIVFCIVL